MKIEEKKNSNFKPYPIIGKVLGIKPEDKSGSGALKTVRCRVQIHSNTFHDDISI